MRNEYSAGLRLTPYNMTRFHELFETAGGRYDKMPHDAQLLMAETDWETRSECISGEKCNHFDAFIRNASTNRDVGMMSLSFRKDGFIWLELIPQCKFSGVHGGENAISFVSLCFEQATNFLKSFARYGLIDNDYLT